MRSRPRPVLGIVLGLCMGIGLSLVALLIYALKGPGTYERLGISLAATLALYLTGGMIGGALFGALLPITRYRWGASIVGVCAALPVYLGAALVLDIRLVSGMIGAIVVGGSVGYMLWFPPAKAGG